MKVRKMNFNTWSMTNTIKGIDGISRVNTLRVSKFNLKPLTVVWKHSCRIISSTDLREWSSNIINLNKPKENTKYDINPV